MLANEVKRNKCLNEISYKKRLNKNFNAVYEQFDVSVGSENRKSIIE